MGQYGGRNFGGSKGKREFLSREGDRGIPPSMPSGKTDTKADGKVVFLSRQGSKGQSYVDKSGQSGKGAPKD